MLRIGAVHATCVQSNPLFFQKDIGLILLFQLLRSSNLTIEVQAICVGLINNKNENATIISKYVTRSVPKIAERISR